MKLADLAQENLQLSQSLVSADSELVRDIQSSLGIQVDGIWGWQTDNAIFDFCQYAHLNNAKTMVFGKTFAQKLLTRARVGGGIIPPPISREKNLAQQDYIAIAHILHSQSANVRTHLPAIEKALQSMGIYSKHTLIAAIATVGVETPNFAPIREIGSRAYFEKMYGGRVDLGNYNPGDGALYCGRGHIQLTGRANYRRYGELLGIDLESYPQKALQPDVSALVLALYFKDRKINKLADRENWKGVRKAVNGGANGLERFIALVNQLSKIIN